MQQKSSSTEPRGQIRHRAAHAAVPQVMRVADQLINTARAAMKPLDRAIIGIESAFEEEIGLHRTFGGD